MLKRLLLILVVALALPLSALAPADATPAYMLNCKIGSMNIVRVDYRGGAPGQSGVTAVHFRKASGPTSSGLQPGQCSWPDRAMKANEPSWLCATGQGTLGINTMVFMGATAPRVTYVGNGNPLLQAVLGGSTQLLNMMVRLEPWAGDNAGCLVVNYFAP